MSDTTEVHPAATDLVPWIADQLDRAELSDEVGLMILTALEGDQPLDDYLGGSSRDLPTSGTSSVGAPDSSRGTFLTAIDVEGFRGIGPATTLTLRPEPGLTIVAGRNGSGKSSISEALELTLTDSAYRWAGKKSTQWRDAWRNLHHGTARIAVHLVEEGDDPITVSINWADGETDVDQYTTRTQRRGGKQQIGRADLGWDGPLRQFRPILSYDELGAMLTGTPSDLHDAISRVLGVGQLTDAIDRIQVRHKARKGPGDELAKQRRDLATDAAALDDNRAATVAPLLKKTLPDLTSLRGLLHNAETDNGPLAGLRALAQLRAPATSDDANAVAKRLRACMTALAELGAAASDKQLATLNLLEQALRVHAEHGDMTCPVCQGGRLDNAWASRSREAVSADRDHLAALAQARKLVELAQSEALGMLSTPPALLHHSPVPELDSAVAAARTAWNQWGSITRGDTAPTMLQLADHLESEVDALVEAIDQLTESAAECLSTREDSWQPLNARIRAWCAAWEAWLADKPVVDQLADAKNWLQDNDLRLRNERLSPIREGAIHAWEMLKQESNIEIGDLVLEGSSTRRKLRIDSKVDGVPAGGLTVLSQGELHAMALALFLPRATMAESPFRFLVLDDPVQAMDPAKVDGLVSLLSELAQTRQVIVFSHDDRLPAAVRRANFSATIVEVSRNNDSQVCITPVTDPARRYLSDAFGLIKEYENDRIPDVALRRTLPGMLRFAVEAAARHTYFTRNIRAGQALTALEYEWGKATATRSKVTLAIFGEQRENHVLDQWARAEYLKSALSTVGTKMHNGLTATTDPRQAAKDVQRMVDDIEAAAR
ncbi:AAA family ATPase [Nocardia sp. NPDC057663]|uniref:AAA family ATPase n=1 Tax=Nocardia sp. NPDC057663 TaxID=3346201 RepID=UPI0036703ED5